MTLTNHLWQRPGSSFWQLRVPVPRSLHTAFGRREFTRSLKTTDHALAAKRALPLLADLHREWDLLRGVQPAEISVTSPGPVEREPDEAELLAAASHAGHELLIQSTNERRKELRGATREQYEDYLRERGDRLTHYRRMIATGDLRAWERVADALVQRRQWVLARGSQRYEAFVRAIAEAFMDGLLVSDNRDKGLPDPEPTSRAVKRAKASATKARPGESIAALFERYIAQRRAEGGKRDDTINQDRKVIEMFAAFLGRERAVDTITKPDARNFRDTVAQLPPNLTKRSAYKNLSLRDAAAKASAAGEAPISATTLNKYMSTVSPFFSWLVKLGYITANPFDGLHYNIDKRRNPRPPFSTAQLNVLLQSPLFTGFECDGREHVAGKNRAANWRFWIPLISLFTGARIGEVAQLRVGDVQLQHGKWFFSIRHEPGAGVSTKSGNSRLVAVHSKLIELGLLEFHKLQLVRAAANANEQLFPELEPNERGQIGWKPSRFWRTYLAKIGLKLGADGYGAHSFRHTIADQLRLAGYLNDQLGPLILGHSNKTTTSGYGILPEGTATMLHEMIEAVKFEGVIFDHLVRGR